MWQTNPELNAGLWLRLAFLWISLRLSHNPSGCEGFPQTDSEFWSLMLVMFKFLSQTNSFQTCEFTSTPLSGERTGQFGEIPEISLTALASVKEQWNKPCFHMLKWLPNTQSTDKRSIVITHVRWCRVLTAHAMLPGLPQTCKTKWQLGSLPDKSRVKEGAQGPAQSKGKAPFN